MSRRLLALLSALLLTGCGDPVPTDHAGDAVRALAAEDFDGARAAAQRAAETGGERFEGFRYFVRGNAAFALSLEMEAEAERGDPEAGKMAYQAAEDALAYWQRAAASRPKWPAARRNVERGLLRMEALRERKQDAEKPPEDELPPDPVPPETPEDGEPPEASTAKIETADLPAEKVGTLLEVLIERERRKRDFRRAQRRARGVEVERDW